MNFLVHPALAVLCSIIKNQVHEKKKLPVVIA